MNLQAHDLAVARGGVALLEGLNFTVEPGQALVMTGANGIGKTTLLRVLAGLQPALSGQVEMPEDSSAYASHADGVKAALTVRENLQFWADLYRQKLSTDVFAMFDLETLTERPAARLSAGQSRRLGLARLAVTGRSILLLDEPTVSLDTASTKMFTNWLTGSHLAKGRIAVIATHIGLGIKAEVLDLEPFRAQAGALGSDEAFL